jgi:hypothetical protein
MPKSNVVKYLPLLQAINKLPPRERNEALSRLPKSCIQSACEICFNVLYNKDIKTISYSQLKQLKKHKSAFEKLISSASIDRKRRILQKGGFLGTLLSIGIPLISSLLGLAK